jgi:hypothetical protein
MHEVPDKNASLAPFVVHELHWVGAGPLQAVHLALQVKH